jgi:DMSO/TMAO reductase YedYZ molybdopterin-dependent catalytic subunit
MEKLVYRQNRITRATHWVNLLDRAFPVEHGASLRLRIETQLGYKHAKYIRKIEFVPSYDNNAAGKGGYWEDQGYEWYAGI